MNLIVVIEKEGFITYKKPKNVLDSDEVIMEGNYKECNDFIHSKRKSHYEKVSNNGSSDTTNFK